MQPVAFFRIQEVEAVLRRAARSASMPVSVHFVKGGEGPNLCAMKACSACARVMDLPGGAKRCRMSRLGASEKALRRNRPVTYLCHMGFACVCVPALPSSGLDFVLTLGPFSPSDAPRTLEQEALNGFAELGEDTAGGLPVPLDDINDVAAEAAAAVAEWAVESLTILWDSVSVDAVSENETGEDEPMLTPRRRSLVRRLVDPYHGADIAALLAGGHRDEARRRLRATLREWEGGTRTTLAVKRARTVAMVSAVLEAATRAGVCKQSCWDKFEGLPRAVGAAETDKDLVGAALQVLGSIKERRGRAPAQSPGRDERHRAFTALVLARLPEGITLNEVAAELGEHPTAITHRLQRKYGMSYSQYVGRLRVDAAKDLLAQTRLKVADVARRVGVSDPSNFNKLFRRFEGTSALEYRRRCRGK